MSGMAAMVPALALCLPALLSRMTFLAPTRAGWAFYYPNVFKDWAQKRLGLARSLPDAALFAAGAGWIALLRQGGPWAAASLSAALLGLIILNGRSDRIILNARSARKDFRWKPPTKRNATLPAGAVPHPSYHPDLTLTLEGPFIQRLPAYDLGDLHVGRTVRITVLFANHSRVWGQVVSPITCSSVPELDTTIEGPDCIPPLQPGQVFRSMLLIRAIRPCEAQIIRLTARQADRMVQAEIRIRGVFQGDAIADAQVRRYPGGRRSAFAWRGDMDHYDRVSFQSIEGLERTLSLAARYRVPQTMYLSSRLCLMEEEARLYYDHFGVDRGAEEIPAFVRWLKEKVDLRHSAPYPFASSKPYCMELGNHMHLHYGTDAAAAPENRWTRQARMGSGSFPWQGSDRSSFAEQRDNALECRRLMEKCLGFTPLSWAMPDSTRDGDTPRAVEAAGCRVASDADAGHRENVLTQPPPHHPAGTRLVELTKRYPGDPEDTIHVAMIQHWIHRAWRRGIPVIFMGHQHLRQFNGEAGLRCAEALLRHVVNDFHGDVWINTVFGIGSYWGQTLSPQEKTVSVEASGLQVTVRHTGYDRLSGVPVDVRTRLGRRFTVLVDLEPGGTVAFGLEAAVPSHG